jgi:acyl-CoA hydrolase
MDNFYIFEPIVANKDLEICSYITYNGNTSLEVRTDLYQIYENQRKFVATALFLMVAR